MSKPSSNFDQAKYVQQYHKNAYDRLNYVVPKGRKADIDRTAASNGETVNGMINRLLRTEAGMSEEEWKQRPDPEQPAEPSVDD